MMNKSTLHRLLLGAQDCATLDEYIAEEGGSLPAEYYSPDGSADDAVELLEILWNLSRSLNFSSVRKLSGLTQRAFADEYSIPVRTIENWDAGMREPPQYVLELLLADIISAQRTPEC